MEALSWLKLRNFRGRRSSAMGTVLRVWTQEEVQSVIRFLWAKWTAPIEIHHEIQAVYGSNVMTVQHVRKWCREFSGCRKSVTDEQRSGRPSASAYLVPAVEESVHAYRRVLLKELEEQFNLSHGTIWDIVHKRLGYRKVCSRWVPGQQTEDHKENRMGASLTHLFCFNDLVRISWSKSLLGMKLQCTSTVLRQKHNPWHGNIRVSHCQKIQDINQLWGTDGNCVLGHAWCASVALFSSFAQAQPTQPHTYCCSTIYIKHTSISNFKIRQKNSLKMVLTD